MNQYIEAITRRFYISKKVLIRERERGTTKSSFLKTIYGLNLQAPVAQKTAYEVVFRHFQGERVEFFKVRLHFSVSFISRSSFESDGFIVYSNE